MGSSFFNKNFIQGYGKTKTREQILAEERDYKRRRMSYRGKKAKRSHTQVKILNNVYIFLTKYLKMEFTLCRSIP